MDAADFTRQKAAAKTADPGVSCHRKRLIGNSRNIKMEKYEGKWFIQEMELWDKDFIDLVTPGFIEIEIDGSGEIQFGCVNAQLDCRVNSQGTEERLDFSFEGQDEGDPINGRGYAKIRDKILEGRIFFHMGDESGFTANRQ